MKLTWKKCSCGHPTCKLEYPVELGQFYQGSGFQPEEKTLIERAFVSLNDDGDNSGFELAKTRMLKVLERQAANEYEDRTFYILGSLTPDQLSLVRTFVASFHLD